MQKKLIFFAFKKTNLNWWSKENWISLDCRCLSTMDRESQRDQQQLKSSQHHRPNICHQWISIANSIETNNRNLSNEAFFLFEKHTWLVSNITSSGEFFFWKSAMRLARVGIGTAPSTRTHRCPSCYFIFKIYIFANYVND